MKKIIVAQFLVPAIALLFVINATALYEHESNINNLTTRLDRSEYKIQDIESKIATIAGPFSDTRICFDGLIPTIEKEVAKLKSENAYFRVCIENFIRRVESENAQLRSSIESLMRRVQALECKGPIINQLNEDCSSDSNIQALNNSSCTLTNDHNISK